MVGIRSKCQLNIMLTPRDEGLDPVVYDFSTPPESVLVRGVKEGRLSGALVLYE